MISGAMSVMGRRLETVRRRVTMIAGRKGPKYLLKRGRQHR
jgi:hypothetical protein